MTWFLAGCLRLRRLSELGTGLHVGLGLVMRLELFAGLCCWGDVLGLGCWNGTGLVFEELGLILCTK